MTELPEEDPEEFYTSGQWQFYMLWLRGQGREQEAAEIIREATIRTGSPQAHLQWGISLLNYQKQPEAAILAFQEALRHLPDFASAWHQLGEAFALAGRDTEALESYAKSLAFSPRSTAAYIGMAGIYQKQGQWQDAVQAYQDAMAAWPQCVEAHLGLTALLIDRGRFDEALVTIEPMITGYPNLAEVHLIAGDVLRLVGRDIEARLCWQRVLTIREEFVADDLGDEELDEMAAQAQQRLDAMQSV